MKSTIETTPLSIDILIEQFDSGYIGIPEIQRDFVWKDEQIKDLVDSILNDYPCGSLIFWEPLEKDKSIIKSLIRPERLKMYNNRMPTRFLLDGQQRLTALASIIVERSKFRKLVAEIDDEFPYIFIRSLKTKNEFKVADNIDEHEYPWILLNKVMDNSYLHKKSTTEEEDIQKYLGIAQKIKGYQFPCQIIRGVPYKEVAEMFTRINSEGTPLTGAEIYLAKIIPEWRGMAKEFRKYRKAKWKQSYEIDLATLAKSISAIQTDKSPDINKFADKVANGQIEKKELNKAWKGTKKAIDRTITYIKKYLCLDKSKYIISYNSMIPLIYYFSKNRFKKQMLKYFVLSQLSGHYGQSGDSVLKRDFRTLTDIEDATINQNLKTLIDEVVDETKKEYRGLRIKSEDIYGSSSKNVLVLLMYILMRKRDAKDFEITDEKGLDEIAPNEMHLHHIFPYDLMIKNKEVEKEYDKKSDYRSDINSIANLTFISETTNSGIKTAPSEYLPEKTTKENRKNHFIPEDKELWKVKNFPKFLEKRQKMISKEMTALLKYL